MVFSKWIPKFLSKNFIQYPPRIPKYPPTSKLTSDVYQCEVARRLVCSSCRAAAAADRTVRHRATRQLGQWWLHRTAASITAPLVATT